MYLMKPEHKPKNRLLNLYNIDANNFEVVYYTTWAIRNNVDNLHTQKELGLYALEQIARFANLEKTNDTTFTKEALYYKKNNWIKVFDMCVDYRLANGHASIEEAALTKY